VQFQLEHPGDKTARYITRISVLTRQQQLDVCGVCHSGNDQSPQQSLFAFAPGDTLSHYYMPDFGADNGEPDVHGKQVQLLKASMCFKGSSMTCTTCHSPHEQEANKTALFISKCMECHGNSAHAAAILKDNEQKKRDFNLVAPNCIDCHMPLQISKTIHSMGWTREATGADTNQGGGLKNIPYLLRTHKIAIYKATNL
jgi:hypothetical protein